MNLSKKEKNKIEVWVKDFVTIMNGSTFSDNESYTNKLRYMASAYIKNAFVEGKQSLTNQK